MLLPEGDSHPLSDPRREELTSALSHSPGCPTAEPAGKPGAVAGYHEVQVPQHVNRLLSQPPASAGGEQRAILHRQVAGGDPQGDQRLVCRRLGDLPEGEHRGAVTAMDQGHDAAAVARTQQPDFSDALAQYAPSHADDRATLLVPAVEAEDVERRVGDPALVAGVREEREDVSGECADTGLSLDVDRVHVRLSAASAAILTRQGSSARGSLRPA